MCFCYNNAFTTVKLSPILHLEMAASDNEDNPNEEVDQGGLLPEEGEGMLQGSLDFCHQKGCG